MVVLTIFKDNPDLVINAIIKALDNSIELSIEAIKKIEKKNSL